MIKLLGMNQELAIEIMLAGHNVFLSGPAGSGKSFLLNKFIDIGRSLNKKISVTATTGLAATHIGGITIHSWSGMGIHEQLPDNFFNNLSISKKDIIAKTDVLIIDEVSMLHDYRLDMIDNICRVVRNKMDIVFGGLQIILCGDLFQLPPINKLKEQNSFIVNSASWNEMDPIICYLNEQYRQKDERLLNILNGIRNNNLTQDALKDLNSRIGIEVKSQNFTELYTNNIDTDNINDKKLSSINEDEYSFERTFTGNKNYVDNLAKSILAPPILKLKIGALVMALKNNIEKGYINGSIGKVVDFDNVSNFPIVKFNNGKTAIIEPDTWELSDGEIKKATISQLPLRLAWAITIHKSQGMTLDGAIIDLRKAFIEGMGYVALSRVKSLESLILLGLNRISLSVSQHALSVDYHLKNKSKLDSIKYEFLRANKTKRELNYKNNLKNKNLKPSWKDRINEMRKTYPNAYKPWSKVDDNLLKQHFQNGVSVNKISEILGRNNNSIALRLKFHYGEDIEL